MRKLYIFGNGIGMAVSADAFNLPSVMSDVWHKDFTDPDMRALVAACLPDDEVRPTSEDQLATLQDTVSACEVLLEVRDTGAGHWLSDEGRKFPNAVHEFSYLVARKMFLARHPYGDDAGKRCVLPEDFILPLVGAVKDTQSHVATLNYDGLLSKVFEDHGVLSGDDRVLFDGFVDRKFDRRNLFRTGDFGGWYLHLHGSPLFVDREKSKPRKLAESTVKTSESVPKGSGRHVVLTHFKHKPKIIESSEILSIYWEFLEMAIEESSEVVLFGYSGNDTHLNRMIAQVASGKPVKVVEWLGAGSKNIRKPFWEAQVGSNVELKLLEDVLTFSDW